MRERENEARESWKSAFGVGLYGDGSGAVNIRTGKRKPRSTLAFAETGVTKDQVTRWRREGLLPKGVEQDLDYHGSVVRYPKGTCAQIRAAAGLFKENNRVGL